MENQDELLAQIHQGNHEAMSRLIKAELPKVYNLSLKLCKRPEDAEDLCQDVFIRAIRSIKNFKGEASISTWLYRITVNTWKNRIRYENRRHSLLHVPLFGKSKDEGTETAIEIEDPMPQPETVLFRKEEHKQAMRALQKLRPEEKAIIVLRDVEDRSYEEIGQILDLSLGTVKSRLARAREQFREAYNILEVQHQ